MKGEGKEYRPGQRQPRRSPEPSSSAACATTGTRTSMAEIPNTTPPNSRTFLLYLLFTGK